MASKRLSPAANLLRHSKFFALPTPLRPHPSQNPTSRIERHSETATRPFPTHAAIETTPAALRTGDWGLKRSLPHQAGRSSTPVLRIEAVDTADHITDYDSAADHVLTLEKWQEMDIPLSLSEPDNERRAGLLSREGNNRSAFEERTQSQNTPKTLPDSKQRWRSHGPWILGMTNLDFEEYVDRNLRRRRIEFIAYIREHLTSQKAHASRGEALLRGNALSQQSPTLTEPEFLNGIRKLRTERLELWGLMWTFLDIPGEPPTIDSSNPNYATLVGRILGDNDDAPQQTHPSAGLAYSRSGNHLYNHPSLGPQRTRPPVHARVVQHANVNRAMWGNNSLLGVGGVLSSESTENFGFAENTRAGEHRFDADVEGGGKSWVVPKRASIESDGRIKLEVEKVSADTVAVWENKLPPGTSFNPSDPLASLTAAEKGDRAKNSIF